jgi:hypothetical protein
MEPSHKNKKDKNSEKPVKASRVKWTESAIKALLSFLLEHKEKLEDLKYKRDATVHDINIRNFYCYANKKSHHIKVFVQLK